MLRIFHKLVPLYAILLGHTVYAQQDSTLSFHTIKVLCENQNALPFVPVSYRLSGKIIHTVTDEFSEIRIPKQDKRLVFQVSKNLGFITGDSVWNPNMSTLVIATQVSAINPVSITTAINPRLLSDNPYSIQVIPAKTIAQMGAQNVSEVLQNQSGVLIGQDPSLGTSVQLQGLGGQNVKILVNGVPMIGRLNGNIDVSQIPTEQIERIEIVEGPMSVVYGTDAIGGVINIITKTPIKVQQETTVKSYADAVGNINNDFAYRSLTPWNLRKNTFLGIDVNAGRQFFQGFDFNPESRSMDWKPKTRLFGDAQVRWKQQRFEQSLRYARYYEYLLDRSDAEYNLINVTGYNNYFHTQRQDIAAVTNIRLNRRHSLKFQHAYNLYQREKINVRRNLVTGLETITRPEDQDTTSNAALNLRGLWEYQNSKGYLNTLLGYEIQRESLTTQRVQTGEPINDIALFGSIEYQPTPSVNIKPSVRIAHNSAFGRPILSDWFRQSLRIVPIIPSLQIKTNISEHSVFRISYARGFRSPTAKELYFLFVDINHNVQGNPLLQAENSHNVNASMDYRHSVTDKIGVTFKATGFYTRVTNQIQLSLVDLSTNLYQYINIGNLHSEGATVQSQLFIGSWNMQTSFSLLTNTSKFDANSQERRWIVPQGTFNLNYDYSKTGTALHFFSRFTGKTQGFIQDGSTYELASYWLADLNLTQKIWNNRLQIQFGAKNLFNVSQIQNAAANSGGIHGSTGGINIAMGRNYFVQCSLIL